MFTFVFKQLVICCGQPGVPSDTSHGEGVDGVVTRDSKPDFPVAHHNVPGFAGDPEPEFLKNANRVFLANPGEFGHQTAISMVSALLMPDSSASTKSQSVMASLMAANASSRLDPWEWHPGRSKQETDHPSSVSIRRMRYFILRSWFFVL